MLTCMLSFLSFSRLCDHFGCCTLTEEWLKCSCIYAIFGFSLKGYELFQPLDFYRGSDDRTGSHGNQGVGIIQNFSSFGLELTELYPLEALWMHPKVFPLVYWRGECSIPPSLTHSIPRNIPGNRVPPWE